MFEPAHGRWLGLRRNLRPLRARGGNKKQNKNRGAKLSHRTCRSKLESADRCAMSPKLDLLSDLERCQRSAGSTTDPGFQSPDRCRQEWRELRPPQPQF